MRGGGGDGVEVCRCRAGSGVGTTLGELGSMSARAGGGGRWSVGGSGRQVVDVLVQLAKRFLRAVMAWSWASRDEAGASAIAEDR
jgi:hypothetical protein